MMDFEYEDYLDFKHEIEGERLRKDFIDANAPIHCILCDNIDVDICLIDPVCICKQIQDEPSLDPAECPLETELI